jgi:hypothetical protein
LTSTSAKASTVGVVGIGDFGMKSVISEWNRLASSHQGHLWLQHATIEPQNVHPSPEEVHAALQHMQQYLHLIPVKYHLEQHPAAATTLISNANTREFVAFPLPTNELPPPNVQLGLEPLTTPLEDLNICEA